LEGCGEGEYELCCQPLAAPIIRYSPPRYLMAGLGSRGCTTSPWVSEQLANHLCNAAEYPLPKDLIPDLLYERYCRKNGAQSKR